MVSLGWRAKITGASFISKELLIEFMDKCDPEVKITRPSGAKHYILYKSDEVSTVGSYDLTDIHKANRHHKDSRYMAVSTSWDAILRSQK